MRFNVRASANAEVRHLWSIHRCHQRAQDRRIVPGMLRKAFIDDDSRKVGIKHCSAECVLETAGKDRLIDESINRTTQLPPFGGKAGPVCRRNPGDNQGFKIRPAGAGLAKSGRQQIRHFDVRIGMRVPIPCMLTERSRLQRLRDAHRQRERACRIACSRAIRQGRHQAGPGIRMIFFGHTEARKLFFEAVAIRRSAGPCLGRLDQSAPFIRARAGARKKLIDPTFLNFLRHSTLPTCSLAAQA